MFREYAIALGSFTVCFFLSALIVFTHSNELKDSALMASMATIIVLPFSWIFIKEKVHEIKKIGRYPTLSERLRFPWGIAEYSMAGFMLSVLLARFFKEENKLLFHSLITLAGILFLLSIIVVITGRVNKHNK